VNERHLHFAQCNRFNLHWKTRIFEELSTVRTDLP
jgi:hypothetical protein